MRWLVVHAHPDDESLFTGVFITRALAAGHEVHLLTCTLGQEGEVIPPELRHLQLADDAPRDEFLADPLAAVRLGEWQAAVDTLRLTSARFLGHLVGEEAEFVRDSGMAGSAAAAHPQAFVRLAPHLGSALAQFIAEMGFSGVITYDARGGYEHPDHVAAHELTVAALQELGDSAPPLLVTLCPVSWVAEDWQWLHARAGTVADLGWSLPEVPPANVVPDSAVSLRLWPGSAEWLEQARRQREQTLAWHRTQVQCAEGMFALSNGVAGRLADREGYGQWCPDSRRLRAVDDKVAQSFADLSEGKNG